MSVAIVAVYIAAMLAASLLAAAFGPAVTPWTAFVFIGLDLTVRDWLHERVSWLAMAGLIGATSLLTWAVNPAARSIAVASAVAFGAASVADWLAYTAARRFRWMVRANLSNVAGAAVDSALFPMLAFGAVLPWVTVGQFAAKVGGGAVWAVAVAALVRRRA